MRGIRLRGRAGTIGKSVQAKLQCSPKIYCEVREEQRVAFNVISVIFAAGDEASAVFGGRSNGPRMRVQLWEFFSPELRKL